MPIALTLLKQEPVAAPNSLLVSATFSGSYTSGGDTLDMTPGKMADPSAIGAVGPNRKPKAVEVASENLGGAYVEVIPGTGVSDWKLQAFAAGGTEESATSYPAAFTTGSPVTLRIDLDPLDC